MPATEIEKVALHGLWNRRHTTKFNGVSYPIQRAAAAVFSAEGRAAVHRSTSPRLHGQRAP